MTSPSCDICYETILDEDNLVFLECLHYLCKFCFRKLQIHRCPFCRHPIRKKFMIPYEKVVDKLEKGKIPIYDSKIISIKVRRCKRRKQVMYLKEYDMFYEDF
jgi:hypothetical protein